MARIQAQEVPLLQIFSDAYAFRIPSYQRPYRWGVEQADQLFKDVFDAANDARHFIQHTQPGASALIMPYFLGSLVLAKKFEDQPEADVVDGQQRLTTLALLFATLQATLTDKKEADNISKMLFEEGSWMRGTKDRCRLTLRENDHDFFRNMVLADPGLTRLSVATVSDDLPEAQANIIRNGQHLLNAARALSASDCALLGTFLLQHTYLVVVATESLESAFRIFSVLNDRGLDLTAADILKAEIIGKIADEKEREEYTKKWEDLDLSLSGDSFDRLMGHVVMIHHRQKLKETMLKAFRRVVKAEERPKEFIDQELLPYADSYAYIENANLAGDWSAEINRTLGYLHRLDERDWVPAALMLFVREIDHREKLARSLSDLERLAIGLWLNRVDENDRIERYGKVLAEIETGSELGRAESAMQLTTDEMQRALEVLNGDIYNLSPKQKRTAILLRLDEALSSGEASYDHKVITIEHVLPQQPLEKSEWLGWWPDPDRRRTATHRLGNLALLNRRQNSAAKNWDFAKKKGKYFTTRGGASPFVLTTETFRQGEWTPEVVADRQTRFLGKLQQEWRLTGRTSEPFK
jgi:hypothetical protein